MKKLLYLSTGDYITYAIGMDRYTDDYDVMCFKSDGDMLTFILEGAFHYSFFERNKIMFPCSREEFEIVEVIDG